MLAVCCMLQHTPFPPRHAPTLSPLSLPLSAATITPRYLRERRQFGAPLASFQLMQEKLARMLGNVNVSAGPMNIWLCYTATQMQQML